MAMSQSKSGYRIECYNNKQIEAMEVLKEGGYITPDMWADGTKEYYNQIKQERESECRVLQFPK